MAKFRVGDLVTIREWDDMAQEYGVADNGDIKVCMGFPASAKMLCGKVAQITEIGRGVRLKLVNPVKAPYVYFTTDMLEPLSAKGRVDVEIGSYAKVVRGKAEGCFVLVSDDGHGYNEVGGTVMFPKERRGEHYHFEDADLEPVTEDINWFCL